MLKIALILAALTGSFAEIDPEILASKIGQVLYERRYSQFKDRSDLKVMVPLSFIEDRLFCEKTKPHFDKYHKPGLTSVFNEHPPVEHEHHYHQHNPHGVKDFEILQSILHKPYYVLSEIKDKFKPHGIKDHESLSFLHKPNHGHPGIKDHESLNIHKPDIFGIKDHESLILHKPNHGHHGIKDHGSLSFLHKPVNHGHHGIKDHETFSHINKPDILGIKEPKPYHEHEQIIHGIKEHVQSILHKPINVVSGIKETVNEHNHGLDYEGLNLKPVRDTSLEEIKTDQSEVDHESSVREDETTIVQEQQSPPNEEVTTVETPTEKATTRPLRRRKPTKNQNEEGPFWLNIFTTQRPINKKRESTRKSSADKKSKTPENDETRVNKKVN